MSLDDNKKNILKVLIMYLVYFLYTYLASYIISALQIENTSLIMFLADFLFLIMIVLTYRKELTGDFDKTIKDFPVKRIVKSVILGFLAMFLLKMFMGIITELISPNPNLDANTLAILGLLKTSPLYVIFKTIIFATVAEEILFRKSLSSIITNDFIFVIITSIIYTSMNFIFNFGAGISILDILMYFLSAVVLAGIYVKNDRNIYIVMIVKFIFQFIPFIMLLAV